jgi:integral membrane protein
MIKELFKTAIGRFRIIAFMEGLSFITILFVTMPLKYQFGMPLPNLVIGMLHGILFILYIIIAVRLKYSKGWDSKLTVQTLAASVIPFGTFYMDHKVFSKW